MDGKWSFNETEDGLWYHEGYDTKEEAIEAAKKYFCNEQEIMYVGRCETVPLPTYIDVDDIFERLNEHYAEDCFEYDNYLFYDVKKEDYDWLEHKLQDLMLEFYEKAGVKSGEFTIVNIFEITMR